MLFILKMYNCIIVFKCLGSNKIDSDSDSEWSRQMTVTITIINTVVTCITVDRGS